VGLLTAGRGGSVIGGYNNSIYAYQHNGGRNNYSSVLGGKNNTLKRLGRSTIIGGYNNLIDGDSGGGVPEDYNSSIVGGNSNVVYLASDSVILGGQNNKFSGDTIAGLGLLRNSIIGGSSNEISAVGNQDVTDSVIIGGINNYIKSAIGSTVGGRDNTINKSNTSSITTGRGNTIFARDYGFIGGGKDNYIKASKYATIVGGREHYIYGSSHSFIGSGSGNTLNPGSDYSSIIGGKSNTVNHSNAHILGSNITSLAADTTHVQKLNVGTLNGTTAVTVLGIDSNNMVVDSGVVPGGGAFTHTPKGIIIPTNPYGNYLDNSSEYTTIIGGQSNSGTTSKWSIIGGKDNIIGADVSTANHLVILNGDNNTIFGSETGRNVILNGSNMVMSAATRGLIGNGDNNDILQSTNSTILNGRDNYILTGSTYGLIGGGRDNVIDNTYFCNIGGGKNNKINVASKYSVIGGGENNLLTRTKDSFIGGGVGNMITGTTINYSVIVGGKSNVIHQVPGNEGHSSILGGQNNNVYHDNTHIIGSNLTSISANTTHVEKLNVGTLNGTTPITNLALDVNGFVVDGSSLSGGTFCTLITETISACTNHISFYPTGNVGVKTSNPTFDLEVNGTFGATSKSFVIPHPLKEDKKLVHGAIEGPEFGVYDRGRFFDGVIELPDYWINLVDELTITVQLTGEGYFMSPFVKEIKDNKVFVGNRFPFIKATGFYTVYGERKDIDKIKLEIDA
jgi:hypothetical protein